MKAEIICVVDRSGSMQSMATEAIGGFNTFIEEQKKVPGEARVTFCQFDNVYEIVYQGKSLADVPALTDKTFVPRGGTALLDAMGKTLNDQGQRIAADKWAEKVIVVILTDGGENASQEYKAERVKEMTQHAQDVGGWSFVYLGANQDSFSSATALGINTALRTNMVQNYAASDVGMRGATEAYSAGVTNLRTTGNAR